MRTKWGNPANRNLQKTDQEYENTKNQMLSLGLISDEH